MSQKSFQHIEKSLRNLKYKKAPVSVKRNIWKAIEAEHKNVQKQPLKFSELWTQWLKSLQRNIFTIMSGVVAAVFVFGLFQSFNQSSLSEFSLAYQNAQSHIHNSRMHLRSIESLLDIHHSYTFRDIALPKVYAGNHNLDDETLQILKNYTVQLMKHNTQAIESLNEVRISKDVIELLYTIEDLNQDITQTLSQAIGKVHNNEDTTADLVKIMNKAIIDSEANTHKTQHVKHTVQDALKLDNPTVSVSLQPSTKTLAIIESNPDMFSVLHVAPVLQSDITVKADVDIPAFHYSSGSGKVQLKEEVFIESK